MNLSTQSGVPTAPFTDSPIYPSTGARRETATGARISDLPLFEVSGLVSVYRQVRKAVLEHLQSCSRRKLRDTAGVRDVELHAHRALYRALTQRFESGIVLAAGTHPYTTFGIGSPTMSFAVHVDGLDNLVRDLDGAALSIAVLPAGSPPVVDNVGMALVGNLDREQLWFGCRQRGAWSNDGPLAVSTVAHVRDAMLSVDGVDEAGGLTPTWPDVVAGIRLLGSTALGLVRVAQGGFDAHVQLGRRPRPEEYLAGVFLVEQAGGKVRVAVDESGVADPRPTLIAANSNELLSQLEFGPSPVVHRAATTGTYRAVS